MNELFVFTYGFIILSISIIIHEIGHAFVLEEYNDRKPKIRLKGLNIVCGEPKDYENLTDDQLIKVYLAGIFAGFIPVLAAGALVSQIYYLLIAPMIFGSFHDLGMVFSLVFTKKGKVYK
jgi:hypothetical protein